MKQAPKKGETYVCAHCGGTFESGWSDEEAAAEAKDIWTEDELRDSAVICDDCFQEFMGWMRANRDPEAK